jgi:hypothetical protein
VASPRLTCHAQSELMARQGAFGTVRAGAERRLCRAAGDRSRREGTRCVASPGSSAPATRSIRSSG